MLRLAQSLVFCVLFLLAIVLSVLLSFSFSHCIVCSSCLFLLAIVLSVLRFTDSDYPFDIFKLFLRMLEGGDPSCNNNYIA